MANVLSILTLDKGDNIVLQFVMLLPSEQKNNADLK